MHFIRRALVLALFSFLLPQVSLAGISTNGTAVSLEENNAWFLGPKTVEYRIEKADTFRADTPALRKIVHQSLVQWRAFFKKYGLDKRKFKNLARYRNLALSLRFKEVATCEKPEEQLRFLFGVENKEIYAALDRDEGALALAIRGIYNHDTYRNGGFIYIRSAEADVLKMHHMVLHELGHIFGMSHDSVSVMNSKLAYDVIAKRSAPIWFGRIESPLWPYRFQAGEAYRLTYDTQGGLPNSHLGPLSSHIGFPLNGRFQLDLVWEAAAGIDRRNTLVFSDVGSGKTQTLVGFFKEEIKSPALNFGPMVHLLLECRDCVDNDCSAFCGRHGYGVPRFLDPEPNPKFFNGYFVTGNTKLPATIVMRREVVVRIFDPDTLSWWGFGN